jgi:hypothetical protein
VENWLERWDVRLSTDIVRCIRSTVQYDVYEYGRSSICIAWRTYCCGFLVHVSTQIT